VRGWYDRFDRFQRQRRWLGFPLAVRQKYSDDQGGYLAATVTYYAFFSIFPLLLVFVSVLGFALRGDRHLEQKLLGSALGQFPIIGEALRVHALRGSLIGLFAGGAAALWSGMAVFLAAENAMNQLWGIPHRRRPDFFRARAKALLLLLVLGSGVLATTILGAVASADAGLGVLSKVVSILLSTVVDFGLFWVGFRVLTSRDVGWRAVRGGAAAAAIFYELLQLVGGYYVAHVLKHASTTYGTFGIVIGLLSWIYLGAHITLLAAEGNVVAHYRLWPRSFSLVFERPLTDGDRRALAMRGEVEERRSDEDVDVRFDEPREGDIPEG
jgi:inner membrane protein YhjD